MESILLRCGGQKELGEDVMRYLVLSDIHGDVQALEVALQRGAAADCTRIIILGDNLNHGARNKLPSGYKPSDVVPLLNTHAAKIMALRGNCDGDVDGMLFDFPCNAPYLYLTLDAFAGKIFMTHGHLYDFKTSAGAAKLGLTPGDIVLSGHTHVPGITPLENGVININPGSVGIPRGQPEGSFAIIDDCGIEIKGLSGQQIAACRIVDGKVCTA